MSNEPSPVNVERSTVGSEQRPPTEAIGAALLRVARRSPQATAIVFPDCRWTYAELLNEAAIRARSLQAMGIRPGEVVGLAMADEPEAIALFLGAALYGAIPALFALGVVRASVLAPRLPYLAAKAFIISGDGGRAFVDMIAEAHAIIGRDPVPAMHVTDDAYRSFIAAGADIPWDVERAAEQVDLDDDAAIVFTSGMTGVPKTCPVSHRNIMCKAVPFAECFELSANSRIWIGVRMCQIGFISPLLIAIATGAAVVVSGGLDADGIRALISAERVTHAYPIYLGTWLPIINSPRFWPSDFSQLSHVGLVGPVSALRRVQRALPQAVVMNMYGSAEEAGAFCMPRANDPVERRLVSSGRPFAGHEVRIVEPDRDTLVRAGQIGEIQVRGEGVPKPRQRNELGSTFTPDGWLRTSDLGAVATDRSLTYHGRSSEMLRIGQETVSAVAIETVLALHPDVAVAQVVGRPDPDLGEVVAAFIELRPGGNATAESLVSFCRDHLPAANVPRYVVFMSEWPTSAAKIFKPALSSMPVGRKLLI
jgi:fatty-acyl-CoA synthase